jgi:hypothetical protein
MAPIDVAKVNEIYGQLLPLFIVGDFTVQAIRPIIRLLVLLTFGVQDVNDVQDVTMFLCDAACIWGCSLQQDTTPQQRALLLALRLEYFKRVCPKRQLSLEQRIKAAKQVRKCASMHIGTSSLRRPKRLLHTTNYLYHRAGNLLTSVASATALDTTAKIARKNSVIF